jgi:hypothetical protein
MIAAFGDLDVRRGAGRGQQTRRALVVEIVRQIADRAFPSFARKPPGLLARAPFRSPISVQDNERRVGLQSGRIWL